MTVAPLLCSSALGLMPLCSIDRLEHDLRAASSILHATHPTCFRRLLAPGFPRIHEVQTFLQLSARLVELVSGPFLRLQDCSVSYPGFSELAHSACFFLQTFADCWTLDEILLSALAMEPEDEPCDLIGYLAVLDLPKPSPGHGLHSMVAPMQLRSWSPWLLACSKPGSTTCIFTLTMAPQIGSLASCWLFASLVWLAHTPLRSHGWTQWVWMPTYRSSMAQASVILGNAALAVHCPGRALTSLTHLSLQRLKSGVH